VDKLLGAGPIIATASTDDELALARSLGADIAINYRQDDDWPNQVLAATDGRGADVILEGVGGGIFAKSLGARAVRSPHQVRRRKLHRYVRAATMNILAAAV
jgi:NADPH:quinone reductase-like Zn-dependent oxidoreductase